MAAPTELSPGTVFGREFRVLRALRTGGMGAVYVVEQESTGKQRALKVMAPELASDATARERFVREAKVGAQIESQHVVEVVTAGVDEQTGMPFLVMELLKGEELGDVLARVGPLPLGDVAEVLAQAGHALEQAHAKGIVHRDLKPENLFVGVARGRGAPFDVKILDFGIAKLVADREGAGTQALGTPLYMPPEQTAKGAAISPASDVWALGLIAFKLLTGRDFWRTTDSIAVLLRAICVDPIPAASERARELAIELPAGFDAWFARCLDREPSARFPEAGACVRAFAEFIPANADKGRLVVVTGGGADVDVSAKTVASASPAEERAAVATAPPSAVTAAPARKRVPVPFILAGLALLGGGVYFGLREDPPIPVNEHGVVVAPSASASTMAAKACPAGMVSVPGGNMFMGTKEGTNDDAKPPHKVTVASFCLDAHEVTTASYESCVQAGNCLKAPQDVQWPDIATKEKAPYSQLCNARRPGREQHPINCVDWSMADNFCKGNGKRLPTEAEWELAARGPGQRTYPWGDEPPAPDRLNACGTECQKWMLDNVGATAAMYPASDGYAGTAPVGSFPKGATQSGLHDLAGNVWEWTADWYGPYTEAAQTDPKGPASGTERVVRGGGFNGAIYDWAKPSFRWKTSPETYNHAIGFRCAAPPR